MSSDVSENLIENRIPKLPKLQFNYLYVKPNNRNNIEAIAFMGNWPAEFDNYFEVDYERMFRKSFMPVIESMFKIKGWIKDKEKIEIESSGLDDFFV